MNSTFRKEIWVAGTLTVILLVGVVLSGLYARREVRDGIRKQELRKIKHELEMYFNEYDKYPLDFNDPIHDYVVVEKEGDGALGWFVRAELENAPKPTAGFDLEYNNDYRVVRQGGKAFYDLCGGNYKCDL